MTSKESFSVESRPRVYSSKGPDFGWWSCGSALRSVEAARLEMAAESAQDNEREYRIVRIVRTEEVVS